MRPIAFAITLLLIRTAASAEGGAAIRIWGDDGMERVVGAWESGFREQHPGATFAVRLMGSGTGMAGLYSGTADLAILGRAATAKEIMAFEWVRKYKPLEVEVLSGSLGTPRKSPAVVLFVHRDNPLSRISFDQLERMFVCGPDAVKWGDLGLGGEWAGQAVRIYMPDAGSGTAAWFRAKALGNSRKWRWESVREFDDETGRMAAEGVEADRYGIAVSNGGAANAGVKALAISAGPAGPWVEATAANVAARSYPLARSIYVYLDRAPGKPVDARVAEFLQYVMSGAGQRRAQRVDDFLALPPEALAEQRKRLE